MRPELSILSFMCALLLCGLGFLHAKSRNVAVLSFILWLLAGNIIQGVNSIIWFANDTVHSEVWCDIGSKLLLGSRIALPAVCSSMCIHLHYLSSSGHTRSRQRRLLLEVASGLILPIIYMALHTIVQSHRFVLTSDFGCIASIHTSIPALILVWLPPILLCVICMAYASLALWHHVHRSKLSVGRHNLSSRLIMVSFLRPLVTAVFTSSFILVASIFDIYAAASSAHGIPRWQSIAQVHSRWSNVLVIPPSESLQLARIEVFWWIMPTSTLVFSLMAALGLLLCSEDGSVAGFRSARKWFHSAVLRRAGDEDTFVQTSKNLSKGLAIAPPTPPLPVHLSVAGWDDTLRESARAKPKLSPLMCDIPPMPASPTDSESECDATFKASTLAYLRSPTGRETIPLHSHPTIPASSSIAEVGPRWSTLLATPPPAPTSLPSVSPGNSILSSPWPRPPSTIPISPISPPPGSAIMGSLNEHRPTSAPTPAHRHARPSSLSSFTGSLASIADPSGYVPDPDIFLHGVRFPVGPAPFQHAGIPTTDCEERSSPSPRGLRRASSKESLNSRSLSLSMKRGGGLRRKESYGDAVYMTVVHETQAV